MGKKHRVRNCLREREGLYNGNVQQSPLCAVSCVTKDNPISPRFSPTKFYRDATRSTIGGGGGEGNKFVPVLGGNGMKTAPSGDIFDQLPGQMR